MNAEQLVSSWLAGRATLSSDGMLQFGPATRDLMPAKFRKAYYWICSNAILTSFAELEAGTPRWLRRGNLVRLCFKPPFV